MFQLLGEAIPGPLFDVGILLYHSGRVLLDSDSGPYLYLPKVKSHSLPYIVCMKNKRLSRFIRICFRANVREKKCKKQVHRPY